MSSRVLASLLSLWLLGCGAASAPETHEDLTQTADDEHDPSGATMPIDDGACTEPCTAGHGCHRPDGWLCSCNERFDVICGGAYREREPSTWQWDCAPTDLTTDRGDGCPFGLPAEGSGCSGDRACRYPSGACGFQGVEAQCASGTWHHQHFMIDPPP